MAFRPYFTLLLLLNYLLVVGAGLVERPARPIDRPFAYVHSHGLPAAAHPAAGLLR